jgi:hypothetical protein
MGFWSQRDYSLNPDLAPLSCGALDGSVLVKKGDDSYLKSLKVKCLTHYPTHRKHYLLAMSVPYPHLDPKLLEGMTWGARGTSGL